MNSSLFLVSIILSCMVSCSFQQPRRPLAPKTLTPLQQMLLQQRFAQEQLARARQQQILIPVPVQVAQPVQSRQLPLPPSGAYGAPSASASQTQSVPSIPYAQPVQTEQAPASAASYGQATQTASAPAASYGQQTQTQPQPSSQYGAQQQPVPLQFQAIPQQAIQQQAIQQHLF